MVYLYIKREERKNRRKRGVRKKIKKRIREEY